MSLDALADQLTREVFIPHALPLLMYEPTQINARERVMKDVKAHILAIFAQHGLKPSSDEQPR